MKVLMPLFVFMISLYSTEISAQISKSYNYSNDANISSIDYNYYNTGLVIYESNSYIIYPSKSPNFFLREKPMYHVQLELNRQADSFNPYNVKSPFEAITIGFTNLLFDKIQGK